MSNGKTELERLRLPKAAELVASQIRRQIVRGELSAGEQLPPESRLMEAFGISRPTLRESLRVLESEGLIEVHRGSRGGARVREPDPAATARSAGLLLQIRGVPLSDVLDTQLTLECGAIYTLSTTRRPKDIVVLRELLEKEQCAIDDLETFSDSAVRFHEGLIEVSGNESLRLFGAILGEIVERHTKLVADRQPRSSAAHAPWREKAHKTHEKVVDLIEAGEAVAAEDLWRRHAAASRRAMNAQAEVKDVLELFD